MVRSARSRQQASCCTCPVTTAQPSVACSVSKRPVARANEPMARFQPPLVETNAQRSITRQLRAVQGSTGRIAQAVASAAAPSEPSALRARFRGHLRAAGHREKSERGRERDERRVHQRAEAEQTPGDGESPERPAIAVADRGPPRDDDGERRERLGHDERGVDDEARGAGRSRAGRPRSPAAAEAVAREAVDEDATEQGAPIDGVGERGDVEARHRMIW